MGWHVPPELLVAYEQGRLDPVRVMAVEAHVTRCTRCRESIPIDEDWLARGWASRGGHVILSGRDEARLAEVAGSLAGETLVLPFDVRDDAALADATAKALAWKGGVDLAVANAGISQRSMALETDMQVYREIIEVDLLAQIAFAQGLIGAMTKRGSGALAPSTEERD